MSRSSDTTGGGRVDDLVTVVIPTSNRRALLARTLETVLAQRAARLEVVVVDDHSRDGTAEYLATHPDHRVRFAQRRSPGPSSARNQGIAMGRGRWTAFTDDDDLWAPDKLAAQLEALRTTPGARWVTGEAVRVDHRLRVVGAQRMAEDGPVLDRLLRRNEVPGGASGVLAETSLLEEVGSFDEALDILDDWDLWIRLAARSPLAVVHRPLHAYRVHPTSMSATLPSAAGELDHLEAKYAELYRGLGVRLRRDAIELWLADRAQRAGRRAHAAAGYLRSRPLLSFPRAAAHAAEALLSPGAADRRDLRRPPAVPSAWAVEADRWLDALRHRPVVVAHGASAPAGDVVHARSA